MNSLTHKISYNIIVRILITKNHTNIKTITTFLFLNIYFILQFTTEIFYTVS